MFGEKLADLGLVGPRPSNSRSCSERLIRSALLGRLGPDFPKRRLIELLHDAQAAQPIPQIHTPVWSASRSKIVKAQTDASEAFLTRQVFLAKILDRIDSDPARTRESSFADCAKVLHNAKTSGLRCEGNPGAVQGPFVRTAEPGWRDGNSWRGLSLHPGGFGDATKKCFPRWIGLRSISSTPVSGRSPNPFDFPDRSVVQCVLDWVHRAPGLATAGAITRIWRSASGCSSRRRRPGPGYSAYPPWPAAGQRAPSCRSSPGSGL